MITNPVIITKRNVDSEGNPISIYLIETKQIFAEESVIVLKQVPDELYRVKIQGYKEVFDIDKLKPNEFKVDYVQGVVYFHPKAVGKTVVVEYYGIGYELISCSRIFTKYDKYGNVLETLEELIGNATEQLELIKTLGDSVAIIDKLETSVQNGNSISNSISEKIIEVNNASTTCVNNVNTVIQKAKDEVINVSGNKEFVVLSSEWVLNGDVYEKQLTHTLNSENLHVTTKDRDTKDAVMIGYKILDKSNILLKSDEAINMSVILSASYYHAVQTISDNIAEEVIRARKDESSLDNKIGKIDESIASINEDLEQKANKNEIFTMANMGQDIKEKFTGGSVAVVGENTVLPENIVSETMIPTVIDENTLNLLGVVKSTTIINNYYDCNTKISIDRAIFLPTPLKQGYIDKVKLKSIDGTAYLILAEKQNDTTFNIIYYKKIQLKSSQSYYRVSRKIINDNTYIGFCGDIYSDSDTINGTNFYVTDKFTITEDSLIGNHTVTLLSIKTKFSFGLELLQYDNVMKNKQDEITDFISGSKAINQIGECTSNAINPLSTGKSFVINKELKKGSLTKLKIVSPTNGIVYIRTLEKINETSFKILSYNTLNIISTQTEYILDINIPSDGLYLSISGTPLKQIGSTSGNTFYQIIISDTDSSLNTVNATFVNGGAIWNFSIENEYVKPFIDYINTLNSKLRDKIILCIGDSLTAGDYGSNPIGTVNVKPENYPYFLAKNFGCTTVNAGVCGASATTYWGNTARTLDFTNVDIIVINLGTNGGLTDTLIADTTITSGQDYNNYADTNTGRYCKIIEYCLEKTNKKAQIFLVTPPKTTLKDDNFLKTLRNVIFQIGDKYSLPVIDFMNESGISKFTKDLYQPIDGLHLGLIGYERKANFIGNYIESKLC